MAQQNSPMDRNRYSCSICLDLLCDPVILPCGHSYCFDCITDYWNTEDVRGVYSCPQCRQTFTPRPAMVKNTVLADLMEDLKKTEVLDAPPDHCYAGPEDVGCDVCTRRKMKAIKSCLDCLTSFCEEHLQSHFDVAGLRRHKLVEPTADLHENICSRHDEVIKIFCRQDRQTICFLCSIDEHRGHHTVSAEAERNKRQKDISKHQKTMQGRIQKLEEDVKVLQQEMDSINRSADEAVKYTEKISVEMTRSIEGWRSTVNEQIRTKEKTEVCRVVGLQKNLEQEIVELKGSVVDLQHLSQTQSHITFLQKYPWNLQLGEHTGLPTRVIHPVQYLNNVTVAVAKMTSALEVFLKGEISHISLAVAQVDVLLTEQPQTREDFLQYSCDITIDISTKTEYLSLSEGNRRVTAGSNQKEKWRGIKKSLNPPDWATGKCLSKERLTGRQYWELKCKADDVSIAMGYKDYSWSHRGFGNDDKSWNLSIKTNCIEFKHNKITTKIPGPRVSRVGVYLDYRAGILCFYNISDKMVLLHKVQTTFTQPLYAGIWLNLQTGGSAEFCYPLQA